MTSQVLFQTDNQVCMSFPDWYLVEGIVSLLTDLSNKHSSLQAYIGIYLTDSCLCFLSLFSFLIPIGWKSPLFSFFSSCFQIWITYSIYKIHWFSRPVLSLNKLEEEGIKKTTNFFRKIQCPNTIACCKSHYWTSHAECYFSKHCFWNKFQGSRK